MKTFLRIALFIFVLLTGVASIAFYWTFYRPLPDYNGTISHPKLQEEADIHWDTFGVPHIYASNSHDLYFSLGYVHAQDRLWQMTVSQMAAEGRFAEFLGKEMLPYDQLQRTLGFWRIARKIEDNLSEESLQILQAYADGVNAYTEKNGRDLPIQFVLADMDPIPWTPTHSIALARLMAWELNLPWKAELTYAQLAEKLSPNHYQELFPNEKIAGLSQNDRGPDSLWASAQSFLNLNQSFQNLLGGSTTNAGSNAWAVGGQKTNTAFPLLAGDPHLPLGMPGKWYEVHLNLKGDNLSGATLAGAPAVILGQNDFLAWSLTNIMLDDTDFFQEAVNPENPDQYILDTLAGEPLYEDFIYQREVIRIKDADDTTFTRRLTHHGPVISNIYRNREEIGERVITMKWTGQETTNELKALLKMGWSRTFEEFREAVKSFKVPGQNVVYADKEGNIARLTLAKVPIRSGNPITLRKGWDSSQDWQGYLEFEDLPHTVNPDRGWVANANNPVTENFPTYFSVYWEPDSRYNRIRQYLSSNETITSEIFQVMQNDSYSDFSKAMTEIILPVLKENDPDYFSTVISYLENWDYSYQPSETAASIIDVFLLHLSENTFMDEMGNDTYDHFINFSAQAARTLLRFTREGSLFFDNINTPIRETQADIITESMRETVEKLQDDFGSEPYEWRWENLHSLTLEPPLFGQAAKDSQATETLKLIVHNVFNSGPHSPGGHAYSINKGEYHWHKPYKMIIGASIRRIVDFSNLSNTLSILPGGQSGNPLSQYYGDQTESWLTGQYKFLYQDSSFFRENQYRTMHLVPE